MKRIIHEGDSIMLNDIKEWISDYLRYILLGAAVLLLILIIVFAVRLIGGHRSGQEKPKEKTTESELQTEDDNVSDNAAISTAGDELERNQKDVLDLMTRYYTAKLNKDYDTLDEICEVTDDEVKVEGSAMDDVIEQYNNLMTYSKAGLTDGSYIAFAYFDAKLTGIDTLVPTLRSMYLVTNEDGNLIVSNTKDHPEQQAYQKQVWTDDDVQALCKDVADRYDDCLEQNPDLEEFLASIKPDGSGSDGNANTDGNDTDGTTDGENGNGEASLGTMYASTGVNVRGEPDAESTLYGTLQTGMQVEVLENLDNGWSRVSYVTSDGTTIEGYMMTQYLTDSQ